MNRKIQFGSRLEEVSIEADLSKSRLAKRVGIGVSYKNSLLDPPSTSIISKIASILSEDINDLLILANKIPYGN